MSAQHTPVKQWSNEQVLSVHRWPAHFTVDQARKTLAHWEKNHPEVLKAALAKAQP